MKSSAVGTQKQEVRQNEQKWSPDLWNSGWVGIPNVILQNQQKLGLDSTDINILLQLLCHWWTADNLPHPGKETVAEYMGVDASTVRRHIAKMEAMGLVKRVARKDAKRGQKTNYYDFSGLVKAATPFAIEALALKEKRRAEDAQRRILKPKSKFSLITPPDDNQS